MLASPVEPEQPVNWLRLVVWGAWLAYFLFFEFGFLFTGRSQDTLSETDWSLEKLSFTHGADFSQWQWPHWLLAILVWGLWSWLIFHLPFGWLR